MTSHEYKFINILVLVYQRFLFLLYRQCGAFQSRVVGLKGKGSMFSLSL
jgi:hypothetical protein